MSGRRQYKRYCLGKAHLTQSGPMRELCPECFAIWRRLHSTYHAVISERPEMRAVEIDEVFSRLWAGYRRLEAAETRRMKRGTR